MSHHYLEDEPQESYKPSVPTKTIYLAKDGSKHDAEYKANLVNRALDEALRAKRAALSLADAMGYEFPKLPVAVTNNIARWLIQEGWVKR